MQLLIETRLQEHRGQLRHLRGCMDREMSGDIRRRDGMTLRYLHGQITVHLRVIEELELLLSLAREHPE